MFSLPAIPGANALLGRLPAEDLIRISRRLKRVNLDHQTLCEPETEIRHAYFPVRGLISIVAELESGRALEVATVGPEGMAGIALLQGTTTGDRRVVSRIPGEAFAMTAGDFVDEVARGGAFHTLIGRYSAAYVSGLIQTVACNGSHRARHRLARWLLVCQDAACENDFPITQDSLAAMLGVLRPTVSLAAERLRRLRAISYRHGRIRILDRAMLEHSSCECYSAVRMEYQRLLSLRLPPLSVRRRTDVTYATP